MNSSATSHSPVPPFLFGGHQRARVAGTPMLASLLAALCAFSWVPSAHAEERVFLPKEDTQALADGKKWTFVRLSDQNNIRWDLSSGGRLFARNNTSGQSDGGTWLVNESGQLCVKWRGSSTDRCLALLRNGAALKMVDSADLAGTFADLTVE